MFTLECMPKDADLFFTILDERNSALKSYFIRQEYEYNTVITCSLGAQNELLTFREIDIKDCVDLFSKLSNYLVYRVTTQNPSLMMSKIAWLSEDLGLFASYGADFVEGIPFTWEEQHVRSKARLLLNITG